MIVEINVMLILTTIPDVIGVIMKYVSLAAIANIPRFYFTSLTSEHMLVKVSSMELPITKYRTRHNPLEGADPSIYLLRVVNKFWRLVYACWSYYFMPFTALFLNISFMITPCKCWGDPEAFSPPEECPREIWPQCLEDDVESLFFL